MNKKNLNTGLNNICIGVRKHSPELLTGLGIAGFVSSNIFTAKASFKIGYDVALRDDIDPKDIKSIAKEYWKEYVPTAVSTTIATACIITGQTTSLKRQAAIATAYEVSRNALVEYRDKVTEVIGEEKESEIRSKIAQDKIDDNPVSNNAVIITGKGKHLCYDEYSEKYFESDYESIRSALNDLNALLLRQDYVSLNTFYDLLGVPRSKKGDKVGWNATKMQEMYPSDLVDITFSTCMSDDNRPCISIGYSLEPFKGYDCWS